jgi:hypothetical protein
VCKQNIYSKLFYITLFHWLYSYLFLVCFIKGLLLLLILKRVGVDVSLQDHPMQASNKGST